MANFSYTVKTKDGTILKGVYEANDKGMVIAALKAKGYVPLQIKEKSGLNKDFKINFKSNKVSTKDISVFCRQFSAVIDAGIPVLECIDIIRKQTESGKLREILNDVYEKVQKGRSLSESLKQHKNDLPSIMINMVEAGEASGTLDKVMGRLAVYFAKSNKIRSEAIKSATYPLFIFGFSVLAVVLLMILVVPKFEQMFKDMGAKLPFITQLLLNTSRFITGNFILLTIVLVGAVAGLIYFIKTERGKRFIDKNLFKFPIISGVYSKMVAATFTRTLASLLAAGVPLIQAVEITDKVINNSIMEEYLGKVRDDVTKGSKFSAAVSNIKTLPNMVVNMVFIGEESGSLDAILDKTADFFEDESETAIMSATTLIEPLAIAFMAIVVGVVVLAIVMPMANMITAVQNLQ